MSNFTYFSEAFYVGLVGGGFAFLGLLVRYAYKSKCSEVNLCCIRIKRDIDAEAKEDLVPVTPSSTDETAVSPPTPTAPLPPVRTAGAGG